jgi:hypothetical protein
MCHTALFLAAAVLGADVGWQPLPNGGVEYIIEISPDALESLRSGQEIQSDIPPSVLPEIRSCRILAGNKKLRRELPPVPTPATESETNNKGVMPAAAPAPLPPNPASRPLPSQPAAPVQSASAVSAAATAGATSTAGPGAAATSAAEPPKPWLSLWLIVVGLFASLAANLFLAWTSWDARHRYRALLEQGAG